MADSFGHTGIGVAPMRFRVGTGGKHSTSRTAPVAVAAYAPAMTPVAHVAPVAYAGPTVPGLAPSAPHAVPPTHASTPGRAMPQVPDTDGRLAQRVAHTAVDLAAASGVSDWLRIEVRVGIGFSEIDVQRGDGSVVRCEATSEKFSEARRELVQQIRNKHQIKAPAFSVVVSAADLDDVRFTIAR